MPAFGLPRWLVLFAVLAYGPRCLQGELPGGLGVRPARPSAVKDLRPVPAAVVRCSCEGGLTVQAAEEHSAHFQARIRHPQDFREGTLEGQLDYTRVIGLSGTSRC